MCQSLRVADEGVRQTPDALVIWADATLNRLGALHARIAAGEEVTAAERHEAFLDILATLDGVIDNDRVSALIGRFASGEDVPDPEALEILLEAFASRYP